VVEVLRIARRLRSKQKVDKKLTLKSLLDMENRSKIGLEIEKKDFE